MADAPPSALERPARLGRSPRRDASGPDFETTNPLPVLRAAAASKGATNVIRRTAALVAVTIAGALVMPLAAHASAQTFTETYGPGTHTVAFVPGTTVTATIVGGGGQAGDNGGGQAAGGLGGEVTTTFVAGSTQYVVKVGSSGATRRPRRRSGRPPVPRLGGLRAA